MTTKEAIHSLGVEDYRQGALLRLKEAQCLYTEGFWAGCIYLAGRAAESILRALLRVKTKEQESGHDLKDFLKRIRMLIDFHKSDEAELDNAINELAVVWRNDLRFTADARLRRILNTTGRLRRIGRVKVKGDALKANAKSALEASERIVTRGEPYAKTAGKTCKALA